MDKIFLVFTLFFFTLSAYAAPLRYNMSGQVYISEGVLEDFTGSFVLSDVTFHDYYSEDPTDTRGAYVNESFITEFSLSSENYFLTQNGDGFLRVAWAPSGEIYANNTALSLYFSDSYSDSNFRDNYLTYWLGPMDAQPLRIELDSFGRLRNIVASPVPVPASAWLFCTGLIGIASLVRRKKRESL